jgi:hypothetical protein
MPPSALPRPGTTRAIRALVNYLTGTLLMSTLRALRRPALVFGLVLVACGSDGEARTTTPLTDAPTFSPPAGTYSSPTGVELNCTTPEAVIFFTTDGSLPSAAATRFTGSIPLAASGLLRAIAVAPGRQPSAVSEAKYVIAPPIAPEPPTFNPPAGLYATAQSVSVDAATPGAEIFYTVDGSVPTASSPRYAGPIPVAESVTLQAIAVLPGLGDGSISSARYVIDPVALDPPTAYHVNSVGGMDSGPGTLAHPLRTIAALLSKPLQDTKYIYLARGSAWREEIRGLPPGVNVVAYGAGERPLLDASDIIPASAWVKTVGSSSTYSTLWTLQAGHYHGVWEDGVRLSRASSIAECDATPGSYYSVFPASGGPDLVYVHAVDDSDPATSGRVYEMRKRGTGITGARGGSIIGIQARRNANPDGSILSFSYAKDCLAEDGGKHNFWVEGLAEDCYARGNEPPPTYGGSTLFVSFPSGNGPQIGGSRVATYRRCHAMGVGDPNSLGYYHHTNGGTDKWARVVYEDCTAEDLASGFSGADALQVVYRNPSTRRSTIGIATSADNVFVLGGTLNGTGAPPSMSRAVLVSTSLTMLGTRIIGSANSNLGMVLSQGGAIDIRNCTFSWRDCGGFYWMALYKGAGTSAVFRSNIVSGANHGFAVLAGSVDAGGNDYFGSMDFRIGGKSWATFSDYRAANPGLDESSITSDPLFTGDVGSGDTSIDAASEAYLLGAGADAPGVADAVEALYRALVP